MALRAARRASLVDQVIDQLKEQVASGAWAVGQKIPPEPALAESLGVGRNTVREAVRALQHAGLLECRQGDGTYVRATNEMSGAVRRRLRDAEVLETFEVRRALEVAAARLAAERRTEADVAAIESALERRDAAWRSGSADAFVEADLAFHTTVVVATHNSVLIDLYLDFSDALRASISAVGDPAGNTDVPHDPIAAAIKARDPEAAERATHACLEQIVSANR